jgi:hypothetical protein
MSVSRKKTGKTQVGRKQQKLWKNDLSLKTSKD